MKNFKKFLKISFLVIILLVGTFNIVKADDTITPPPDPICTASQTLVNGVCTDPVPPSTTPPSLNIQAQVDVPTTCNATDTDGVVHNYGADGSSNSYLTVCALEVAIKNGSISSVQLSNQYPSMGLFIMSINGVTADPASQYWAIYQNGSYANSGITLLPVVAGDTIMFQLHDFSDNNLGDQVTLNIHSLISNTPVISGGGESGGRAVPINTITKPVFDMTKALNFLVSEQKTDGSFGEDLYTDWSAMALASGSNYQDQKTKLAEYLSTDKLSGNLLTDYERRGMALMALNLNPYNTNGVNYISKIITSFDGKQFGDPDQDNDDIFALVVLQNAGYTQNDQMLSSDITFILNAQNENGSWDNSVDMTGAAMEALSSFNQNEQVKNALTKAENFLKQNQKDDGSWNDNASSTAWAIEGILAQGEKPEDWTKNVNTPFDYLATTQDTDGGIKDSDLNTKIWETAYVISALSSKTWNQTMQTFEKEVSPKIVIAKKNSIVTQIQKKTKPIQPTTATENTASVINAVIPPATTITPRKNWFIRLLESIF